MVRTFSVDMDSPLINSVQLFIDLWSNASERDKDGKERLQAINLIADLLERQKEPIEFVATFKSSYQISPDDWAVYNPTIKVNSNSKISEVYNFYRTHKQESPMEVNLIQLQK